ncbi:RICIN domain-containing protein [Actinokineospora diospyrosa]|uniref:Ricin-type beta-trefoil lectin domain-containing protein n=1 Tax=Actinokineospora diospyrosa TaxID=103728 RepID=A0ABT1I9N7_9PSEU|nr:RICIN domain-containing protein [Actinokineospora diospyrosa]MCP2269353.1 Ricin-type beta-trefoil lectin domain-containing protein [Actinokineospora diospyrosa]
MRKSLRTTLASAAAVLSLLAIAPAAAAAPPARRPVNPVSVASAQWVQIRSEYGNGGQCLDADLNGGGANGSKVQLWDCNGTDQQKWLLDWDNPRLVNKKFSACLDADLNGGGANGTKLQLWDCNGTDQQKWYRFTEDSALYNGRFSYGRTIVVDRDVTHSGNGAKAQLWTKNFQPQQWWSFE